jgi:hypothetical protein
MAVTDGFLQMPEIFRDSETASMYLLSGLANDFPDATVDVLRQDGETVRCQSCETAALTSILDGACAGFGEVQLTYHPHNVYGYVAEIVDRDSDGGTRRVIVMLTQVAGEAVSGGSSPPPPGAYL